VVSLAETQAARATLQAIADALNARGIATPQGKKWQPQAVKNGGADSLIAKKSPAVNAS